MMGSDAVLILAKIWWESEPAKLFSLTADYLTVLNTGKHSESSHVCDCVLQDGVATEHESTDVAGDDSTVHHNNAVNNSSLATDHKQSSDHNQYSVIFC